jgi:fumarate hydratase class II
MAISRTTARGLRVPADHLRGAQTQRALGVFQAGSGAQNDMNANEVISNRAVHPNDDVRVSSAIGLPACRSAMHIAALKAIDFLISAVGELRGVVVKQTRTYRDLVMVERTHLQDATPLTVG